uniref:Uncharacterized protein n=1 Tax=Chelonoidis abingdonii TaxID=106734 RepID=A0A8C0GGA3_CHEAB
MPPKGRGKSKLPVPLPKGMIMKDTEGKEWRLGNIIGQGGFGLIYLATLFPTLSAENGILQLSKIT